MKYEKLEKSVLVSDNDLFYMVMHRTTMFKRNNKNTKKRKRFMQLRSMLKKEFLGLIAYSMCWRFIHFIAIITLIILGIISLCSFSEPIDIHCNIVHEYEEKQRREEEERNKWEMIHAQAQCRAEQAEKEKRESEEKEKKKE